MTDLPDPPRHIPLNAAVTGLFAGTGCQVSWLLTGLLTVFLVVFAFDSSSFLLARGDTALVSGEIVERRETVLSDTVVGRGGIIHRRGEPVYRYGYRYAVGGSTHLGSSFGHEKDLETTAQLTIEYLKARPCVSRIQGMAAEPRLGGGRTPLIIVLTILLIAVASVTLITRRRLLGFRLARNGVAAQARAANTTLLSRTHHGREWYQIEWEYEVGGRQHALLQRPHYTEHVEPDE